MGGLDNVLERRRLQGRALDQLVGRGDILSVVLVVMKFERALRDEGLQRIVRVCGSGRSRGVESVD